ncbi:hypothetical protein LBMAG56_27370 [Verrucomicrobiota bacterium]|nr:hypothetical protein LBMAG56_27370 [Verrucomicrobiota bacterium]
MLGPIVERSRVEVRAAGPDDGMNLRVECNLRESHWVAEGAVKLTLKNRLEIHGARKTVVEVEAQRIRADLLESSDAVKRMVHGATLLQRRDWGRLASLLQKRPIGEQLRLVKLGPSLNEPLLTLRNEANDERDGRDGKHRNVLAIVSVKMRNVMALRRLGEHPNDDAVKA